MSEVKFCKDCIHCHPRQGVRLDYCGRHRKYVTQFTIINSYTTNKECKDYTPKEDKP